jgi:hypothetical protein
VFQEPDAFEILLAFAELLETYQGNNVADLLNVGRSILYRALTE